MKWGSFDIRHHHSESTLANCHLRDEILRLETWNDDDEKGKKLIVNSAAAEDDD